MQQSTILIAGCGDVGSALGQRLLKKGHNVVGLRRNINQLPSGIQGISTDLSQIDALTTALAEQTQCDILVYSVAASQHDEPGYQQAYVEGFKNLLAALPATPKHIFFTSSTSVYHQNDSSWVDENSPCEPTGFSGRIMLQAEQQVLASNVPATVVRFSGIYGPGRNHLLKRVKRGDVAPESPDQFSNRIHRDDCAGALEHLIAQVLEGESIEQIYLATDDTPATMYEVTHWLSAQMDTPILSETHSRRAGSKRCSNQRLRDSGYVMQFSSYQDGYAELLKEL